jgi:hypothetical protein
MKTLKIIGLYIAFSIIVFPCLCIFNEQPDSDPQRWYINLFGFAYAYGLFFINSKRISKSKKQ